MAIPDFREMTDDELWQQIFSSYAGAGQTNTAAMMMSELLRRSQQRLKDSIETFSSSTDRYSRRMFCLTIALLVLAVAQLIVGYGQLVSRSRPSTKPTSTLGTPPPTERPRHDPSPPETTPTKGASKDQAPVPHR